MGKGGSVSDREETVMPEDAPGNPGAGRMEARPARQEAVYRPVREMQAKLHRWAGEDPSRRFGDLFNLIYDPAFLVHAWERVSTNKGARTPGKHSGPPVGVLGNGGVRPGRARFPRRNRGLVVAARARTRTTSAWSRRTSSWTPRRSPRRSRSTTSTRWRAAAARCTRRRRRPAPERPAP